MNPNILAQARHNHAYRLRWALAALKEPGADVAANLYLVASSYRTLAVCGLLLEADTRGFVDLLCRSGHARLQLLQRASSGLSAPAKYMCVSKDAAFRCSLAAGDLQTARAVALLSPPRHFEGVEYEDDFLFFHFLQRLLLAPGATDTLERLLGRWRQVLQGAECPRLATCEALMEGHPERFTAALDAYTEERRQKLEKYRKWLSHDPELDATEGQIHLEGLAVLRLAELRGIPTRESYEGIPPLARIPPGATFPPPEAWRSFEQVS